MKPKSIRLTITLIALGFILFSSIYYIQNIRLNAEKNKNNLRYNEDLKSSAFSGKIHIDNNWTTTKAAGICTGNGTYSEPYVIEDLVIDGGGSGSCIYNFNELWFFYSISKCDFWNYFGICIFNTSDGDCCRRFVPWFGSSRNPIHDRCDQIGLIIRSVYNTFNNEFELRINTYSPFF